jgi:endonuclease/exonuclease/phosphatase family metal-dependent hydrolase
MDQSHYLIREYPLQQGALEIAYIEEFFSEFPRRKTAAAILRRLEGRPSQILMAESSLPTTRRRSCRCPTRCRELLAEERSGARGSGQAARRRRRVRRPQDLYNWLGATRLDWRGQGHFRALTEEQEVWAVARGYDEIVVKTKNATTTCAARSTACSSTSSSSSRPPIASSRRSTSASGSGRACSTRIAVGASVARVKILTWNVNGVRARQAELQQLLAAEQPDLVCLQEIKAAPDQVPALLLAPEDYWCYWHGAKGYSGVALLVRCSVRAESPGFSHPAFDLEQRIVVADFGATKVASVYVPNGGKDFDVKLRFLEALADWTAETSRAGQALVICGDLNVAREDRDVHPKERKPNQIGTRPEDGRCSAGCSQRPGGRRPRSRSGQRRALHVVGAVAQPAPAEHRLAHRLVLASQGISTRAVVGLDARVWHERSRAGGRHLRRSVVMSLRLRLIVVFFLLSVVPLAAVTYYSYTSNVRAVRDAAMRESDLLAGELSQRMQLVTAQLSERVEHLMDLQSMQASTAAARQTAGTPAATKPAPAKPAAPPPPPAGAAPPAPANMDQVYEAKVAQALGEAAMLLNNVELRGLTPRGGDAGRQGRPSPRWPGRARARSGRHPPPANTAPATDIAPPANVGPTRRQAARGNTPAAADAVKRGAGPAARAAAVRTRTPGDGQSPDRPEPGRRPDRNGRRRRRRAVDAADAASRLMIDLAPIRREILNRSCPTGTSKPHAEERGASGASSTSACSASPRACSSARRALQKRAADAEREARRRRQSRADVCRCGREIHRDEGEGGRRAKAVEAPNQRRQSRPS